MNVGQAITAALIAQKERDVEQRTITDYIDASYGMDSFQIPTIRRFT